MVFFIVHIIGNLTVFAGQDAMNSYALGLKGLPFGLLWIARIGLLVIFAVHIVTAIKLTRANRAARPEAYAKTNTIRASLSSRTMALSGLLILAYLIFHLAHFTWRVVAYDGPLIDAEGRDDVYTMVVQSFQQPSTGIALRSCHDRRRFSPQSWRAEYVPGLSDSIIQDITN